MAENGSENSSMNGRGVAAAWLVSCVAITAVAAVLRFVYLGIKPLHHDEGVNGWFLTNLFRDGEYKYDPANYHGPTLYYITLGFTKIFELDTVTVRSSVAVWGVLTVVLAFFLRRYIGRVGSLAAAGFLALSPGMVYISRYFIHEMFFVFLSLAVVVAVVLFIERRRAGPFAIGWMAVLLLVAFLPSSLNLATATAGAGGENWWTYAALFFAIEAALVFFVIRMLLAWNGGRPIYFLLAAAAVSLMFATKETAFITLGTMAIAAGLVWLWRRTYKRRPGDDGEIEDAHLTWANFRAALGSGTDLFLVIFAAVVLFAYIGILFFSSFFTYPEGIRKAFEAYAIWTGTGSRDHADNGLLAYLRWGMRIEAPLVLLSALGTGIAFFRARHRFAMFAGLWTLGLFLAYTLIPYKTPWLALSFFLPACIAAGYAINEIAAARNTAAKPLAILLSVAALAVLAYQTYEINFVRYDDDRMPYVYAHTRREFLDMVADIERFAEAGGKGTDTAIDVVSPDYWPLVWYVKDYPKAVFHGKMIESSTAEMIVAKKRDQDADVIRRFPANYRFVGIYDLRPGVELVLLVRKDVAGSAGQELYKLAEVDR